ncbi:hypothetical protein CEXT_313001 [Caerostris extrusa]|uniref:Uncharacterized protein n=1 Tax=Caerostris extrusa TaxID=172846 RepID=A0AAV4MBG8_CAEEX|nr:hypothetical protein CEXT_313001 [Caerostris extrusa]
MVDVKQEVQSDKFPHHKKCFLEQSRQIRVQRKTYEGKPSLNALRRTTSTCFTFMRDIQRLKTVAMCTYTISYFFVRVHPLTKTRKRKEQLKEDVCVQHCPSEVKHLRRAALKGIST